MDRWYYGLNGKQIGPMTLAELRLRLVEGEVRPDDLVWCKGWPEWRQASEVRELDTTVSEHAANVIAYETRGLVQGSVAPELRPLPDDAGPFVQLGGQFTVRGKGWFGKVVGSPKAIYLLKNSSASGGTGAALG
jgi:hypothetical protein